MFPEMIGMAKTMNANSSFQRRWKKAAKDLWRLVSLSDLLGRVGTVMIRKSPRMTLLTAAITSSGYLSSSLGLPGFSALEAVVVPSVVFGAMLGGGAALRVIPRAISSKFTNIAQANDLNLMEDYRKSQALEHLNVLWDRIFSHESALRYSEEEISAEREQIAADKRLIRDRLNQWPRDLLERLGAGNDEDIEEIVMDIMTASPLTDEMEKSRAGFIISSIFAVRHPLAQCSQAGKVGYRLNLWEDERDGAYFDRTDTKLFEQYFGNTTITDIKNALGCGKIDELKDLPAKYSRQVWFHLITKKIAIETGKALKHLSNEYNTDTFNSQLLLWPGEENAKCFRDFPGAQAEVLRLRKAVITNTLGKDYAGAADLLDKMLLPLFELATKLRFRYDPEYCGGCLDHPVEDGDVVIRNNIIDDLTDYGYKAEVVRQFAKKADQAGKDMSVFMDYLNAGHSWLFDDKPAFRAVRTAFHINANGIKDLFKNGLSDTDSPTVDRIIEKAVAEEPTYTHRLIALRLHQALTMLQREGYMDLSLKLAYKD